MDALLMFTKSLRSKATQETYLVWIKDYQKYCAVDKLEDLIKEDVSAKVQQEMIIGYLLKLQEKGMSHQTRHLAYSAIKHLYEVSDIILNWKKVASFLGSDDRTQTDRGYTNEEIKMLLDKADERKKVIILTLASTGMRLGGLAGLRLRNLQKIDDIYMFTVYEHTRERYITFCTPECAKVIDSYLKYRKDHHERLLPDNPFIRDQFNKDQRPRQRKNEPLGASEPHALSAKTIQGLIFNLIYDSGLRSRGGVKTERYKRKEFMGVHGFRKFFDTQLTGATKNPVVTELLLGHDIGLKGSYFKPDAATLLNEYRIGINALTIDEANRLQVKLEKVTAENTELKSMREEWQAMRAEWGKKE